jgi:DNA-binding NtrC family response regulator/pSer/pThr/pTyr-binding forkhead associated (FHA) protein
MAELALFRRGEELLRVALGERTRVGRAAECELSLPEPELAEIQAMVERRGDGYHLVDRSGRGTQVGGQLQSDIALADGMEIALGAWRALFRASSAEWSLPVSGATELMSGAADPAPAAASARLRVRTEEGERLIPIPPEGLSVGKAPENDLVLEDRFVSARHLRIERRGGRWHLSDLGSTNGTTLGGARVEQGEVLPGVPVRVGGAELWLEPDTDRRQPIRGPHFQGMVSIDPAMRPVFELIERVAPSDAPVAVLGETGTGKELVARALHARSERRDGAFVPVNCSAIAESLIESELFGHEKGAFSGADRARKGAFEEADGGTIFLDEVGELPPDLQPKLLRVLEQGEVKRVGASRPIYVKVRVIAATHRDLKALVRAGRFREDLYYRLCVVPIAIPPLRQRRADIRALAQHFLRAFAPRGVTLRWSEAALERLLGHRWPGNVRQLRNVVQRALLLRDEGLTIPESALSFDDTRAAPTDAADPDVLYLSGLTLEEIEREAIRLSLRRHRGRRSAVVKELQIAKSTVMKRIGQWGLQHEGRFGPSLAADGDAPGDAWEGPENT